MQTGRRTVLVTGCSDGSLGSALALALHDKGWRVFASARNTAKLVAARDAGIETIQMDVQSSESISAAARQVEELTGGSLDALINNAGTGYSMPVVDLDIGKMQSLFDLNVFSIVSVVRGFLPLLRKSTRKPVIMNNTSGSGLLGCGMAFQGAYNASKAAAANLTEALRLELAPFGIRVVNLVTGSVKSTFFSNSNTQFHPELPPNSMYHVAKEAIEISMSGEQGEADRMLPDVWAKRVAGDFSRATLPYMIFRGSMSSLARLVALLPIGTMDWLMKSLTGLGALEKKLREQKGR